MSGESKIRRLLNKKINRVVQGIPATLGNEDGVVAVAGKSNTCYVTTDSGVVLQVYNVKTPYMVNLPVFIGKDPVEPKKWQVVSVRSTIQIIDDNAVGDTSGNVPHHHQTHEWLANGSNDDIVNLDMRQIKNLKVQAAGGLSVFVNQGIVFAGSTWHVVAGTTVDLSLLAPHLTGKALYVLLSGSGIGVTATAGSEVAMGALSLANIPTVPAAEMALAAVRLYTGQSTISETVANTDIVDLRWQSLGDALAAHATSHEVGGGDELSVEGLSGLLADGQTALAHAASHAGSGSDPLTTHWEPLTYDDDVLIYNHDVLMLEVVG